MRGRSAACKQASGLNLPACLQAPPTEPLILAGGLFNIIVSFLLIALLVAAITSPLIRRAYLARVTRLMGLNQVNPRPQAWWQARTDFSPRAPDAPADALVSASDLKSRIEAREKRIGWATVAAWLAFTLAAIPIAGWVTDDPDWVFQVEFATLAGVLALGPVLVNVPMHWRKRCGIIAFAWVLIMALGLEEVEILLGAAPVEDSGDDESWWEILTVLGLVVAAYAAVFHRRLRGLVFPVCAVFLVVALVLALATGLLEPYLAACLDGIRGEAVAVNGVLANAGLAFAGATLAMIGIWLGFQAVGSLAWMIDRGWLSESSMTGLLGLLIMAAIIVFGALPTGSDSTPTWASALPLAWVALAAGVYALTLGWRKQSQSGHDLLILRVFSRKWRQQAWLDQVQSRWRYLGAVNQAGGPDLIDVNVGPYQCALLLGNRLHDVFLPKAISRDQLRGRLHHKAGAEGRYRVNEMFNFNTAWRQNVEQLILLSRTILIDLRGLTAAREGTSFEVGLLARHKLLSRVVAVGDETTDWNHVKAQLSEHGESLENLKRVNLASAKAQETLFAALLNISAAKAPTQP